MTSKASWWLKVKRAQKHMIEIRREALRYIETSPYEFVRVRQPDGKNRVRYRVRITEQPDPMLALIIGDFIHNLRSALDHMVVACTPRKERSNATSFPCVYEDIFAKDSSGQFVIKNNESRDNFMRAIKGMDRIAQALVVTQQPFNAGDQAHRVILGLINRLDNADKHRQLTTVGGGLENISAQFFVNGTYIASETPSFNPGQFLKDGTIIDWDPPSSQGATFVPPRPSEVQMQYTGTPVIHISIAGIRGNEPPYQHELFATMLNSIQHSRMILRKMEPYVLL